MSLPRVILSKLEIIVELCGSWSCFASLTAMDVTREVGRDEERR